MTLTASLVETLLVARDDNLLHCTCSTASAKTDSAMPVYRTLAPARDGTVARDCTTFRSRAVISLPIRYDADSANVDVTLTSAPTVMAVPVNSTVDESTTEPNRVVSSNTRVSATSFEPIIR